MKYFFPFLVITSQLQKIKIDEKLNRASINELFSREPQIFTQSNGQKSLSGLMSSNNRDVLKWCIDYSKILPPHQRIFRWLMRKIPIRRKSFSQWSWVCERCHEGHLYQDLLLHLFAILIIKVVQSRLCTVV